MLSQDFPPKLGLEEEEGIFSSSWRFEEGEGFFLWERDMKRLLVHKRMYIYTLLKNQNSTGGGSFAREFFVFCRKGLWDKEIKLNYSWRVEKVFLIKWTYGHIWSYVSVFGARSWEKGKIFLGKRWDWGGI
jgi:hypothetical protein